MDPTLVTTITAIQTYTAAVDGEMTSFVHKITSQINGFATLRCDQRMQKLKKAHVIQETENQNFAVTAFQKFTTVLCFKTAVIRCSAILL